MEKQYKSEEKKKTSLEQCQEKGQTPGKKLEVKVSRELVRQSWKMPEIFWMC